MNYKIIKHNIRWVCPTCETETECDMIEDIELPLKGFECQECLDAWWVFPPDALSLEEWVEKQEAK